MGILNSNYCLDLAFQYFFCQLLIICKSTTKFSLNINGENLGYFEGKRELRQGDLISPLLFVLVMKYLTRTSRKVSVLPDFRLHPMCKKL